MVNLEKYSIVWQECGKNSNTAKRFYVPEYEGCLPFFISGQELKDLTDKKKIELREKHLLKGILYGLSKDYPHSKTWHRKPDKKILLYLLDVLMNGFKYKSPEKMILDVAYNIRKKNGSRASVIILEVGCKLIPDSSKIKSDFICDLWITFSENEDTKLLERVFNIIPKINFDEIYPGAKEIVSYYGLCAIVLLGKNDDINPYLEKYIFPNVTHTQLKQKIKDLLENPDTFSAKDLIFDNII